MSLAERFRQEGAQKGIEKGKLEGKLEGEMEKALSIAKAILFKDYPLEDITLLTGLSRAHIEAFI
ncbi:hypothetical protein [Cardinium endosymbiont of Nabis limbatus]|uniref:hypothetical protein n=1 Tax=Cardinium endosymbiont of Nabis limbatus TaxID=3066217 RepID=UPI003AF3B4C4